MTKRHAIQGVYVLAGAFALVAVYLYNANVGRLDQLTREDGVVEYLQAAGFLLAAVAMFVAWARGRFRNLFVLGFALVLFVVGGEEVSWGQRLLGVSTPEALANVNVQGETTLHNIDGIHQSIRAVALVFILGVTVVMPLTNRYSERLRTLYARWSVPLVPLWTLPVTVLAVLFMVVPRLGGEVVFSLDEVGELYVAAAFLLFALDHVRRQRERGVASGTVPVNPLAGVGSSLGR